jgi:hypothetical protein
MTRGEVLWSPAADAAERTRLGRFLRERGMKDYDELWRWSVEDLEGFWDAVCESSGVRWLTPPARALAEGSRQLPGARWFPGGTLNYADHALARAATDPDGVAVPIDITAGADERSVYFRVCDSGPGIDPQNVERAFERFWQAGPGDDVGSNGVGLGLFLVRKIVERQNGWVSLRPRPGGGTVAEVRLPRVDDPLRVGSPGEA